MAAKKFSLIGGVIMLIMGLVALIPALAGSADGLPALKVTTSYGLFLGFFPMNVFNKIALVLFGIAGISVARMTDDDPAIYYCRTVCIAMGALAVFGLIPGLDTLYGFWPLYGGEVIGHGLFALVGGYCGFVRERIHHETELHA